MLNIFATTFSYGLVMLGTQVSIVFDSKWNIHTENVQKYKVNYMHKLCFKYIDYVQNVRPKVCWRFLVFRS